MGSEAARLEMPSAFCALNSQFAIRRQTVGYGFPLGSLPCYACLRSLADFQPASQPCGMPDPFHMTEYGEATERAGYAEIGRTSTHSSPL